MSAQVRDLGRVAWYAAEFSGQVARARECLRRARVERSEWIADSERQEARSAGQNAREWWQLLNQEAAR